RIVQIHQQLAPLHAQYVHTLPQRQASRRKHPLERRENQTDAVNLRSAVEIGPMRYVLGIGLALAVLAFVAACLFGYLPAA
ncbi:MAG: hypothetical protein ACK5SX_15380, partial [Sandaracinobacter sp.]